MNSETPYTSLSQPTYKAAYIASKAITTHFARQLSAAFERGEKNLAPEPGKQVIEAIIDRRDGRLKYHWLFCLPINQHNRYYLNTALH
jgi:hypothetical protein